MSNAKIKVVERPVFQQRLFTTHSNGQVGSWEIEVFDGHQVRTDVTVLKVLGGTPVVTEGYTVEGKNIGRANETTPLEQAIAEAKSKVSKKLDKGYTEAQPTAGQKTTNGLGYVRPMLAQPAEKMKELVMPAHVQPKFDGHRMLATIDDGTVVLYSRQGKVLDVEHIRAALQAAHDAGYWTYGSLDGEVYAHGETLQRISSWVKKPKPESKNLTYMLYDVTEEGVPYGDRLSIIRQIDEYLESDHVEVTETHYIVDENEIDGHHGRFIGEGYEGTIIRHGGWGYEDGKRSKSLIKKKDIQDAEFEIIGVNEGKPNERLGTRLGIYVCRAPNGKEFEVTAAGDAQAKHDVAVNGHKNIGKQLTVFFFGYTPDGAPFHIKDSRIRDDI